MSFHLSVIFFKFLQCFMILVYKSNFLPKFIPKCFIRLLASVNEIVFLIFFLDRLLFVSRNGTRAEHAGSCLQFQCFGRPRQEDCLRPGV